MWKMKVARYVAELSTEIRNATSDATQPHVVFFFVSLFADSVDLLTVSPPLSQPVVNPVPVSDAAPSPAAQHTIQSPCNSD